MASRLKRLNSFGFLNDFEGLTPANTDTIEIGGAPVKDGEVVLTFLSPEYRYQSEAAPTRSLGIFKLSERKKDFRPYSVKADAFSSSSCYNLQNHGFQLINFTTREWSDLAPIVSVSRAMKPTNTHNTSTKEIRDNAIDILTTIVGDRLRKIYGEQFTIVPSRNILLRLGGCNSETCYVPQNPLMHLDYIDFMSAYERQCNPEHQIDPVTRKPYNTLLECPPFEHLVDVINIWFPTEDITDWPLGFIVGDNLTVDDYQPYEILSRVIAASIAYKPELTVAYKRDMKPGEAYIFRSATQYFNVGDNAQTYIGKVGAIHGSFRISDKPSLRHSIELRFMVFKKWSPPSLNTTFLNQENNILNENNNIESGSLPLTQVTTSRRESINEAHTGSMPSRRASTITAAAPYIQPKTWAKHLGVKSNTESTNGLSISNVGKFLQGTYRKPAGRNIGLLNPIKMLRSETPMITPTRAPSMMGFNLPIIKPIAATYNSLQHPLSLPINRPTTPTKQKVKFTQSVFSTPERGGRRGLKSSRRRRGNARTRKSRLRVSKSSKNI